ncbi:hypothetical protein SAMN05216325_101239 [Nitrosomonas marina]|uniref:Uncharacterized protein n=1 Tax=Nitrosomonas marina TaxID=917 RepID=A0A1H8AMT0_9PROT|nr:hypothetical protein SAMN05216325_101239 [Nitrosomonas marina]
MANNDFSSIPATAAMHRISLIRLALATGNTDSIKIDEATVDHITVKGLKFEMDAGTTALVNCRDRSTKFQWPIQCTVGRNLGQANHDWAMKTKTWKSLWKLIYRSSLFWTNWLITSNGSFIRTRIDKEPAKPVSRQTCVFLTDEPGYIDACLRCCSCFSFDGCLIRHK